MPNYYMTQNVNRVVGPVDKPIKFEATELFPATNSWWGVYATEDAEEIALLDELVGKGGVFAITEEEYEREDLKKKRPHVSPTLFELKSWHAPSHGTPKDAGPAVAVEPTFETADEALAPKPVSRAHKKK